MVISFHITIFLLVALLIPATKALAECDQWIARVLSAQGRILVQRADDNQWHPLSSDQPLCPGDKLKTDNHSRVTLRLRNESLLNLDQNTTLLLSKPAPVSNENTSWWIELLKGTLFSRSRQPQRLQVITPFVNAVHEGTEFLVSVEPDHSKILVMDGQIRAVNSRGRLTLTSGEAAIAFADKAPKPVKLTLRPEDAVQWALYYPPLVDSRYFQEKARDPQLRQAAELFQQGDAYRALEQLATVPTKQHSSDYHLLRAAILLSVGRADEAQADIDRLLAQAPDSGAGLALQSVVAVAKNQKQQALALAGQAVERSPESPLAHIAQAYAYQAAFQVEKALKGARKAVELAPDNALAWALLGELSLATGNIDQAVEATQRAVQLNPGLSRSQIVLGFAGLARFDLKGAARSFQSAARLDPADPLPRLGLGLIKIRQGHLKDGTRLLETAASLDPNNALIRSYLGKAYYERKQGNFASTEFKLAKQLDPNDPTPWFYDAIYKQTVNRPVEALHDMQKAIELNDNRAVYRSKLLLDSDLAARSAALGRIYNDLGFQQRGLLEGWKSVNYDPSDYSAHRLLADNYSALPRHEIARVSELLQSQLLQPINITPVQPQLAESNILILSGLGPQSSSFNEFNPLFARNRLALQASSVVGSHDTWGEEVTHSGLWNNFSYSLGQFHFQTDGFRKNANLDTDIYNAYFQTSLTPRQNLQAEFRRLEIDRGDITQRITRNFSADLKESVEEDFYRLGYTFQINPESTLIASIIHKNRDFMRKDVRFPFPIIELNESIKRSSDATIIEASYLLEKNRFKLIAGAGHYRNETAKKDIERSFFAQSGEPSPKHPSDIKNEWEVRNYNFYLYSTILLPSSLNLTLGVSTDFYDDNRSDKFDNTQVNPKIGMIWNLPTQTTLRAAAFRVLKRNLVVNQTIEPTQIAGFNQLFDDFNGTDSTRVGAGIDQKITSNLRVGYEWSKRNLRQPKETIQGDRSSVFTIEKLTERQQRAYLNWTPTNQLAIKTEFYLENINGTRPEGTPKKLKTQRFPIGISYFNPNGLFTQISASYVDQDVRFPDSKHDNSDFWLLDAGLGYRLPKRYGIIRFTAKNLLDKDFKFDDVDIRGEPRLSAFQPKRAFFLQFQLAL